MEFEDKFKKSCALPMIEGQKCPIFYIQRTAERTFIECTWLEMPSAFQNSIITHDGVIRREVSERGR